MDAIVLVLLIAAALLFALAAFGVEHSRFSLLAAGLFCWVLSVLLPTIA
jgi:hypothetical protein